jgi:hypothetical protein
MSDNQCSGNTGITQAQGQLHKQKAGGEWWEYISMVSYSLAQSALERS